MDDDYKTVLAAIGVILIAVAIYTLGYIIALDQTAAYCREEGHFTYSNVVYDCKEPE